MNKTYFVSGVIVCTLLAFGSCKPKQSAYKAAYEQAKEKDTNAPVEVTKEEKKEAPRPQKAPSNATVRSERISAAHGEDASRLKNYSVVIGSFQNQTNAHSLKERMEKEGYKVVLGENEQGMLRVIVASFEDRADAAEARDAFKSKYSPDFQDAWLLQRAN